MIEINKIYLGDCLEIMKLIDDNSIDLIIIDPPYGINYNYGFNKKAIKSKINNDSSIENLDWVKIIDSSYRILKENKSFYIHGRFDSLVKIFNIIKNKFKYNQDFVWDKGDMNSGNLNIMGNIHELILHFSKENPEKSRLQLNENIKIKKRVKAYFKGKLSTKEYVGHPTQKPIKLLEYIIQNRTDENDLILDYFCGSGTTGVACQNLNRRFLLCDNDKTWINIAKNRLKLNDDN